MVPEVRNLTRCVSIHVTKSSMVTRYLFSVHQEAVNRANIDWQDEIHRGILRGPRNISETP